MTSFRTGRGEQPPLFPSDGTRSPGRRRKAAAGRHRKEDLMERDRTRRPLFELDEVPQAAKIKVIGLGGGGSNAVSRMMAAQFTGVEFIVANTDVQALYASPAPVKLQIGAKLTQGLGAGSNPDIGRQAAEEDPDRSEEHTSELQSPCNLVCRLLLEKKKKKIQKRYNKTETKGKHTHRQ